MASLNKKDDENIFVHKVNFNCQHNKYLVSPEISYVECALCGEKLNPVWVISQLAQRENRANMRLAYLESLCEKADKKNSCKCEHCGKMTAIQRS